MKKRHKISLLWFGVTALSVVPYFLFSAEISPSTFLLNTIQLLLLILSIVLAVKDPTFKNRLIFINLSVFFATVILFYSSSFVGSIFAWPYASHVFGTSIQILYYSLMVAVVCYITIDVLFREWKAFQKYVLALSVTIGFSVLYYHAFLFDPLHGYHTERILNWKELNTVRESFVERERTEPTLDQLEKLVRLNYWKDQRAIGLVSPQENSKRIVELFPYLSGNNYQTIILEPLYRGNIYMNILALGCILMYFGYYLKKDPPQGVYVDKLMFLFLVMCSTEIFHVWTFITSSSRETALTLSQIGNYVTNLVYCVVAVFLALRLRFITSIQGEFYEQEIVVRPHKVTRWRDGLDNLILKYFTSEKNMKRRLFAGNQAGTGLSTSTMSEN